MQHIHLNHIHLKHCESTQKYAIEELSQQKGDFLISCDVQTKGRGQGNKTWDSLGENLSFSFNASPAEPVTLTSLEMGVLLCDFFKKHYHLKPQLKWPNDLLNELNQKCGGILINNPNRNQLIVLIGNNLNGNDKKLKSEYRIPAGFLFGESTHKSKKELCYEIVMYIKKNRLKNTDIPKEWNRLCGHMNQRVAIFDECSETHGTFIGIGINGQALLETSAGQKEFYSGSLKLMS